MPATGFFDLPQELRDVIYGHVYLPYTPYRRKGAIRRYHALPTQLELVCKRISAETRTIPAEGKTKIQTRDTIRRHIWREFWKDSSCESTGPPAEGMCTRHFESRSWHVAVPITGTPECHTLLVEVTAAYYCRSWKADRLESSNMLILGARGNPGGRHLKPLVRIKHDGYQKWEGKNLVADSESATLMYRDLVANLFLMTFENCMDGREIIECMAEKRVILWESLSILCSRNKHVRARTLERAREARSRDKSSLRRIVYVPSTTQTDAPSPSTVVSFEDIESKDSKDTNFQDTF